MPSSNHWLFSFTVFLQENTGSTFSRDIQEAVPKPFAKGQCSINPPWQLHSFNTVWIHEDLYFIQPSSFPDLARYTLHQAVEYSIKNSIQTGCQPEGVKLSAFQIYQPPLTLGGFSPS
ncbi:hypothetical protein O181_017095 [Austropuccinia psidii MF-1]|uniref:Uncharacterized protein n=1 Tax=Austropuccinia psidii MF-1 TaxID=1389203 RepID=A0A9Q3C657_9BASI|nr:hypothetical protein [Austropuccinia psidii MF-1]